MASYLSNRSIKTKLALMLLLPVAGLLYFAGATVWEKSQYVDNLHSLQSLIHLARNVEQIAQMAEENSLAVDSVSGAALNLQNLAVALQEKIGKFHY
ncbi:MAG: hypothetical protein PHG47_09075 [Sulfuricella sp.]|nr:hypothetical protein [Sulfuricella sp.]